MKDKKESQKSADEGLRKLDRTEMDAVTGGTLFRFTYSQNVGLSNMLFSFTRGKETLNRCETVVSPATPGSSDGNERCS